MIHNSVRLALVSAMLRANSTTAPPIHNERETMTKTVCAHLLGGEADGRCEVVETKYAAPHFVEVTVVPPPRTTPLDVNDVVVSEVVTVERLRYYLSYSKIRDNGNIVGIYIHEDIDIRDHKRLLLTKLIDLIEEDRLSTEQFEAKAT